MKFREYIQEAPERHAVMAFGRLQPPTTGHEALVNKVKSVAKQHNASHHVVLSHSNDPKQNPLSAKQKVKHARRFFPNTNITTSSSSHPNFLKQAEKLHKSGVTHLHMVAGSDRTGEYHKLLNKYNGTHKGALFNFKGIRVHSAGQRDPDAPGISGMSGSKLRSHAAKGNFNEFKKGVPRHVPEHHAKELFHDLRKGMNIKEDIDINFEFEELLSEGVHDKAIFKAVFLAGGPGSGKDYVLANTLQGHGLTEINSDKAFEYLLDKNKISKVMLNPNPGETEKRNFVRGRAKNITELKQKLALMGRNGLIINGTGEDLDKVRRIKGALDQLGYDSAMIMVNTADEVSKQRNIERGQNGGRTIPDDIRKQKWDGVQKARPVFAELFGDKYMEFDNSEDLRKAGPDVVKQKKDEMGQIFNYVSKFVEEQPQSPRSQKWIAKELQAKDKTASLKQMPDTGQEAHPNSRAKEEAGRLGLEYYGFGRYGKDGAVTHRVVGDSLVQVVKNDIEPKMAKKVNEQFEEFLNEDLRNWFNPNHPDGGWKRIDSKGNVKGDCAREPGEPKPKCMSNKKRSLLSPKERANAVKAKRKHDSVADRKGKGGKPINVSNFGKGKISESIDKGTEVGISMAASGENLARPNTQSNKAKKKPFESYTADAGTESLSAQKEGELKRQGIDLSTFRAKRTIG